MNLTHCTLTGVDDATDLTALADLSAEFPLVEWGFLYSPKRQGQPGRYPSIATLHRAIADLPPHVRIALHVCGNGVAGLLSDERIVTDLVEGVGARKGRIQLNFNHLHDPIDFGMLQVLLAWYPHTTFITQHNPANEAVSSTLKRNGFKNHAILFDTSGGRGVSPSHWPQPIPGMSCGYAGGLGPTNIAAQLESISVIVGDTPTWIDMEGALRTKDAAGDDWFNLDHCRACLTIASQCGAQPSVSAQAFSPEAA